MSEQYPGGFITKTSPTVDGSTARGLWTLSQAAGYAKQGLWPTVPAAPTIGTATAGVGSASVAFTAPSNIGSTAITSYTATSSPGGFTGTGASSPITVSGLTAGTSYTFTVTATNGAGTGPASAASNSITALAPYYIEDAFNSYLYTGNSASGGSQTIVTNIDTSTSGGMVWIKKRSGAANHTLFDTTRGATKYVSSNTTTASTTNANTLTSFSTTGFSVGNNSLVNEENSTYVGWTFKEQTKFFDIVTYTGNGTTQNISHNLGSVPGCIFIKKFNGAAGWAVYHRSLGNDRAMFLNSTLDSNTWVGSEWWNNTSPTSTQFTVGGNDAVNNSGGLTYVAYIFAHDAGGFGATGTDNVISCGSFTTDGSGNATINLGYEPQWLLSKQTNGTGNWILVDTMRGFVNGPPTSILYTDLANADAVQSVNYLNPTATGFSWNAGFGPSAVGIYIAIRRGPMKVPTAGTSVYSPNSRSDTEFITTNWPVDMFMDFQQSGTSTNTNIAARLQGQVASLTSSSTAAQVTTTLSGTPFQYNTGYIPGAGFSPATLNGFRRSPSFFDVVCYTGTGSARTVSHNLGVTPELMIVKRRDSAGAWVVYNPTSGASKILILSTTAADTTDTSVWNNTTPTASVFSVGTSNTTNTSAATYIAYLFATCAGVSKVGSYTGTGATQTIDCGFTAGVRFLMIKRTNSTGGWYYWNSARGFSYFGLLNSSGGETNATYVATTSVGFQVLSAAPAELNASGGSYIFLAIA